MQDEIINEEVITEEVETVVEDTQESVETESETPAEEPVKEYKPWKEKKVPETIPYDRFAEVARERRELETRLREMEAKQKEYEEIKAKTNKITSIDELTSKMGEMSMEDYNRELVRLAKEDFKKDAEEQARIRNEKEAEQRILSTFETKITESSKVNPEIIQAVEHVAQFADRMDQNVRAALVMDDNTADVIYHIATTEGLLEKILTMNPVKAIAEIGRLSSRFDAKEVSIPAPSIPKTMPKPTGSPKTTSVGTPSGGIRKLSDEEIGRLSSSEYAKARKDGRI